MRKFDAEEVRRLAALEHGGGRAVLRLVLPAAPGAGNPPQSEQLRALVRFAIGQGYYEAWNKSVRLSVTPSACKDFPTDRG